MSDSVVEQPPKALEQPSTISEETGEQQNSNPSQQGQLNNDTTLNNENANEQSQQSAEQTQNETTQEPTDQKPQTAAENIKAPSLGSLKQLSNVDKETIAKSKHILSESEEFQNAKEFLRSSKNTKNENLYDHLTNLILKIVESKPENAYSEFENLSGALKRGYFSPYKSQTKEEETEYDKQRLEKAIQQKQLLSQFLNVDPNSEDQADADAQLEIPDVLRLSELFRNAGFSLMPEEWFQLNLSFQKLVTERGLKSSRFFGKIFGTQKDFYVVESERLENEEQEEAAEEPAPAQEEEEKTDNLPKSQYKPLPAVPKEFASGVNRYVYWVTSDLTGEWQQLPDATPQMIQTARQIRKLFTGNLDTQVSKDQVYPSFPGNEAAYLRAQIARISAATVISPLGYYHFNEEEEEEEENQQVVLNPEFEWPNGKALGKSENWVHHLSYILPQGRTKWVNPNPKPETDGDEEEETEQPEVEAESGPALLTPISEDSELLGDIPSWTIHGGNNRYETIYLRSNRWPGAVTVSNGEIFANLYIGWGLKELGRVHVLPALPREQPEFATVTAENEESGAALVEFPDPSIEEEKQWEEDHKEKKEEEEAAEEEEEEEA